MKVKNVTNKRPGELLNILLVLYFKKMRRHNSGFGLSNVSCAHLT